MKLKTPAKVLETKQPESKSGTTSGQWMADRMTAKIGSWAFLTAQSGILVGWIILNSVPGVPHWDKNPFILLNLVFSFASAYTAPIVLMSQNRQSEESRRLAEKDLKVNLRAGDNIELLHAKLDTLQEQVAQKQQKKVPTNLVPLHNGQKAVKFPQELSEHQSFVVSSSIEDNEFDHLFR